jgi:hypothetical protein
MGGSQTPDRPRGRSPLLVWSTLLLGLLILIAFFGLFLILAADRGPG